MFDDRVTLMELRNALWRYSDSTPRYIEFVGSQRISYRYFFGRVNQLARTLTVHVGSGGLIVIHQKKSMDTIALMVACVKHGISYSFVDPAMPEARITRMIEVLQPNLVIKPESDVLDQLSCAENYLHSEGPDYNAFKGCIVFTSGSTGMPKGVLSSYEALYHYVDSMLNLMETSEQTWLSICPAHFDVVQLDFFVQLARGSNIISVDNNLLPQQYIKLIKDYAVTEVLFIATMLKMITMVMTESVNTDLRRIYFGGEGCPISVLEKSLSLFYGVEFCQFYGPTENCNNTTYHYFNSVIESPTGLMPLGQTVKHSTVTIVDDTGMPCPPNEVGELVIEGAQLLSGYINVNTGVITLPEPHYMTGDYGYHDDTGLLWFKGRRDDIVKVNGNRVSLVEVSNTLLKKIPNCTVLTIVKEKNGFTQIITGFYSELNFDPVEINIYLKSCLPKYSLPHKVVMLPKDQVQRLSTGKTDYKSINEYLQRMF